MSEKEAKRLGNDDQSFLIFSEKKKIYKNKQQQQQNLSKNDHGGLAQFINQ